MIPNTTPPAPDHARDALADLRTELVAAEDKYAAACSAACAPSYTKLRAERDAAHRKYLAALARAAAFAAAFAEYKAEYAAAGNKFRPDCGRHAARLAVTLKYIAAIDATEAKYLAATRGA